MTMIFCDGFDSYASAAEMISSQRWTARDPGSQFSTTGGRFGGGGIPLFNTYVRKAHASITGPVKLRFAFWEKIVSSGAPGSSQTLVSADVPNGAEAILSVDNAGKIRVNQLGNTGGAAILQSTTIVTDNAWHWIECEFILASTATGGTTLYIDGVLQGTVASVATATSSGYATMTSIWLRGSASFTSTTFDDFIMWDDQGSTFNTFPLGPQRITQLKPSGDGTPLQFTPNSGTTHYTQVNGAYTTTNYVEDAGTGNSDMYTYPALGYTPSTVTAVVANYWAQNPGSATANLIPKLKTGGTTVSGTTKVLGSGGVDTMVTQVWTTDAGGAAWTAANVNAMQVGVGD